MKIIELRAENIKNLKVVEIRPEDGAVVLAGKNGAGKSAILDSIFMTLTGKKLEEPIRGGERRAEVVIDLKEYRIKKVFTPKGARLEVTGADGAAYPSPQALLDGIVGNLSFDPLAFAEMGKTKAGEREQREILARLVGIDFSGLDEKRQQLYDERTVRFRQIKGMDPAKYSADPTKPLAIDALIGDMLKPAKDTLRVEISMEAELGKVGELERRAAAHAEYDAKVKLGREFVSGQEMQIREALVKIEELSRQIVSLQAGVEAATGEIRKMVEAIERMPEPERVESGQIDAARKALLEVDEKNKAIRVAIDYDKRIEQLQEAKEEINSLTRQIEAIDREKKESVASAKFPIKGLAIDDLRVTYKDKPMTQLSTGEQIRVSAAVAMALNPNLRVILVREGSLLDDDAFKELAKLAAGRDYQLWIEKVTSDKSVGVYIENGEVADVKG